MLFTDELGNTLLIRLQQLLEAEHHLRTLCRRGIAPGRESSLGRVDGLLHGGTARQAELVNRLAGGGVEYVSGARIVCDVFTVDQVLDSGHLRSSKLGHKLRIDKKRLRRTGAVDQLTPCRASPTASNRRSSSWGLVLKVGPNCNVSPPKRT
ncbi:hypothetical protein D3C76_603720 [compost metagenome]